MIDGQDRRTVADVDLDSATIERLVTTPTSQNFDAFYQSEYRALVGLAFALTGSATAAEELAQEAFVAAFKKWDRIRSYDDPPAWVRRVLVNRCRSWGRRRTAEVRAMTRLRDRRQPLAMLDSHNDDFWAAVRSLPARQAQVLALHYLEDMPVTEIAATLGLAAGSVKSHLHRGRNNVSAALGLTPDSQGLAGEEQS